MINKGVLVTLAVVVLLSSVPFTYAQDFHLGLGINMDYCDYDKCVYRVMTGAMEMRGPYHGGYRGDSWFSFWNESDRSDEYRVSFEAFFEANDINRDGAFDPDKDAYVGAIVQPRNEGLSWYTPSFNFSNIIFEVQDNVTTAVHFKHTYNMTFTHQDYESEYIMNPVPTWSGVPGHTKQMNIKLELFLHFYLNTPNQFKVDIRVSGWEWTSNDSILVFVITVEEFHEGIDSSDLLIVDEDNRLYFRKAWIEYAQNASAGNETGQVQVQASQGRYSYQNLYNQTQESSAIFIAFENFRNETLDYNTIIGLNPTDHPYTLNEISYNQLLLTASLLTIGTIVIIFYKELKIFNGKSLKTSA
jgi:hypothetical protein